MAPKEKRKPQNKETARHRLGALLRSWFELTREEQLGILVILGLFLLGLAMRYWRMIYEKR